MLFSILTLSGAENTHQAVPQELLERARQGSAQAQLEAGFAFYKLNNPVRAAYWFAAAAKQNLPEAQYNLARCYIAGYGVEKNLHRALELFQAAAAKGLEPAQLFTARLLLTGIAAEPDAKPPRAAVAADEKTALELLKKLSDHGSAEAMNIYAEYLIKKYPDEKKDLIVQLLTQACQADFVPAKVLFADYLLSRSDGLRNEKLARELLQSASASSNEALCKYAFAVENGLGAPPDPASAFKLYEQSMQRGFLPLAAVRLANFYYTGKEGAPQNIAKAIELYQQAAAAGVPEALYNLGECYKNGIGVNHDPRRAFELLFQAAQQDYPPAQFALGCCFAEGFGTPEDQQAAFYWFNQAAMRLEPRALLEVGKRYIDGNGVKKDPVKAAAFLEQALANGMNEAQELLEKTLQSVKDAPELPQAPSFKFDFR